MSYLLTEMKLLLLIEMLLHIVQPAVRRKHRFQKRFKNVSTTFQKCWHKFKKCFHTLTIPSKMCGKFKKQSSKPLHITKNISKTCKTAFSPSFIPQETLEHINTYWKQHKLSCFAQSQDCSLIPFLCWATDTPAVIWKKHFITLAKNDIIWPYSHNCEK